MNGDGEATETAIGYVPAPGALDTDGLGLSDETLSRLMHVDDEGWRGEVPLIREHFAKFADRLPDVLHHEVDELERRLG